MKKLLLALVMVGLMVPSFSHAQVASTTPTYSPEVQAQITLLQQIIAILIEIQRLQDQMVVGQNATNSSLQALKPTGGAVDNTVVVKPDVFDVHGLTYDDNVSEYRGQISYQPGYITYRGNRLLDTSKTVIKRDGALVDENYTVSLQNTIDANNCAGQGHCGGYLYHLDLSKPLTFNAEKYGLSVNYTVTVVSDKGETATAAVSIPWNGYAQTKNVTVQ